MTVAAVCCEWLQMGHHQIAGGAHGNPVSTIKQATPTCTHNLIEQAQGTFISDRSLVGNTGLGQR